MKIRLYNIYTATPITKNRDPDMTYISSSLKEAKNYFRKKQLIVLESTDSGQLLITFTNFKILIFSWKKYLFRFSPEREDPVIKITIFQI